MSVLIGIHYVTLTCCCMQTLCNTSMRLHEDIFQRMLIILLIRDSFNDHSRYTVIVSVKDMAVCLPWLFGINMRSCIKPDCSFEITAVSSCRLLTATRHRLLSQTCFPAANKYCPMLLMPWHAHINAGLLLLWRLILRDSIKMLNIKGTGVEMMYWLKVKLFCISAFLYSNKVITD